MSMQANVGRFDYAIKSANQKSDVQGDIRDCLELWTKMHIACATRDREIEAKIHRLQESSLALLEKLKASLGESNSETSRKFNEFTYEIVKLEAALGEARQQVQFLSSMSIVDVVERNTQESNCLFCFYH
jgi:hypothetical protein